MQTTESTKGCLGIIVISIIILLFTLSLRSCFSSGNSEEESAMSEGSDYEEEYDYTDETDDEIDSLDEYDYSDETDDEIDSLDEYDYSDDMDDDQFFSAENDYSSIKVKDFLKRPKFTAEKNSSAMVEQIAMVAKSHIDSFTSSDAKKVIKKIQKAGHKFYNGPEEMEKYMWYGFLLDYKYDDSDPRSELGMDLVQAIKYVYRDYETVVDDATIENLRQIDKDLAMIG